MEADEDEVIDVDQLMADFDKESNTRIWEGPAKIIVNTLMVVFSLYCIAMTLWSTELPETKLARFLGLIVLLGSFIGLDTPLTVTQMLWVNLIMDTFAALALASLPPTRKVMAEKPRSVDEHILKGMGAGILGVGGIFTAILLAICIFFQNTDITYAGTLVDVFKGNFTWGTGNGLSAYELGLFFTIFVMLQFWNLFNAKSFMTNESAFKGISWKNTKWFILIVFVILGGQIAMTETPGLQEMFNVAEGGINPIDWLIIIGSTSLVLWIGEIFRIFKK